MNYRRGINQLVAHMLLRLSNNVPTVACTFAEAQAMSGLEASSLHDQLDKTRVTALQLGLSMQLNAGMLVFSFTEERNEEKQAARLLSYATTAEYEALQLREWKDSEHARIDSIQSWNEVLLLEHK